jgi:hypothetical protein
MEVLGSYDPEDRGTVARVPGGERWVVPHPNGYLERKGAMGAPTSLHAHSSSGAWGEWLEPHILVTQVARWSSGQPHASKRHMDKRYQIFISSTFRDLQDERQAILRAVLELDHMPSGMELFPAADDTAWQLIRDVIDASDYYVLIVGGRYGSLDESGIGFTEREYDYALAQKKPIIPLLHQNPDNLPRDKTETDPADWERLKSFRAKIEKRHTRVCIGAMLTISSPKSS